jgi:hypothetical protein
MSVSPVQRIALRMARINWLDYHVLIRAGLVAGLQYPVHHRREFGGHQTISARGRVFAIR